MLLEATDLAVIGAFLLLSVVVGLWCSRRWRDSEDFFLAGRSLIWPFIGLSLFATNISTEHFVGLAAAGHESGLVQGGYEWIASYCLIMLATVFAPQYLRHRVFTIPEFFEKRYGPEARIGLTVYFLAMIVLTKVSLAIFSGATVIAHFTNWDLNAVMWGIGIITAVYTMAGGLAAVVYTDTLQAVILIAGAAVLTWRGLDAVGGWSALVETLQAQGRGDMLSMVRPPTDKNLPFSGYLLGNFLIGGMFYWCMDQVNVQRVLGARDIYHARMGAVFAGFLKIIPVFILVLPGVIAFALYDNAIGQDHNRAWAVLVEKLFGSGLRGLVLAALLAALMSSLSSAFNSVSTLVARDLVARLRPATAPRAQILCGQAALLALMVAGIYATRWIQLSEHVWKYLQEVTAYLSVPFAVAGLLGVFTRRTNRQGAAAGIVVGVAAGALLLADSYGQIFPFLRHDVQASFLHRSFLSAVLSGATMVIVSRLTSPPPAEVTGGAFYFFRRGPDGGQSTDRRSVFARPGLWTVVLFAVVTWLWWTFR
jgi:SSS family solute:Na+ symporter